jgi:acyl-CoA thioesterase
VTETVSADRLAHPFDRAIALHLMEDGVFAGRTSDDYWNFTGPFGGVTAATLLQSVMTHPRRAGTPVAITVNFCAPVARGDFRIGVREVRSNRSTQHWSMELSQSDTGIAATATAAFAQRRETWSHLATRMPQVPAPETLAPLPLQGMMAWLQRYEFRFANGHPHRLSATPSAEPGSAFSQVWVNDKPGRPLDFLSLMALCDTSFGRIFLVRGTMLPIGTVSMTTYFHVGADDLAANGDAPLLAVADAKIFNTGYSDQVVDLWARDGRLLATSHQIVYFRA